MQAPPPPLETPTAARLDLGPELGLEPVIIHRPPGSGPGAAPPTPLVFASPHSGRLYPADMMNASSLGPAAIRRSEDAHVDALIEGAAEHGAVVLCARYARAYVDVNREAYELDPAMFEDDLPDFALAATARVAAGLGSIARVVAEGQEIYARKLTFAEAADRIERVHRPWHAALAGALAAAQAAHGLAVLVDWHSMPSAAAGAGVQTLGVDGVRRRGGCDMVLGDRFGAACAPALTRLVDKALTGRGYAVARNAPYAGGWTTEHYGRPAEGVHALQVEINRALYMDEARLTPHDGRARLTRDLKSVFEAMAAADWPRLVC